MRNTHRHVAFHAAGIAIWICVLDPHFCADAYAQGATVPFTTYEAEEGVLGHGAAVRRLAAPATTPWDTPELEASGRAFVELKGTGDSVTLPNNTGANVTALDIRYSIPDAPQGGGITATLDLYVDGVFRQALPLSSKQTWLYTTSATDWDGMSQDPSYGNPHVFFEEAHVFITGAPVAPGSTITLQKDAANTASFYWIDVMDIEAPPPPVPQSANSVSITDYGAVATTPADGPIPSNAADATSAIRNAITAAVTQGKSVWIPQGRFVVTGELDATGITIEGAGAWYSTVYLNQPLPASGSVTQFWNVTSCTLRNFFVDSNATSRQASDGDTGGINIAGDNWLVEKMWVQHTSSGVWAKGNNGTVRDCRVLSTWGDGVNINNGNSGNVGNHLTAVNNYVRGVGDDGVTINSDVTSVQMDSPTLQNNTTVSVWWADGLRIAGGKNVLVENNLLCDPVKYPGIIVGIFNGANLESGIVRGNTIVRGGGDAYDQHKAALSIGTDQPGAVYVANVQITGNTIIDSLQKAVELYGQSQSILLQNNVVDGLWVNPASSASDISGIDIVANTVGSATFNGNTLRNLMAGQVAFENLSTSSQFQIGGMANVGFDPTVPGPTLWPSGSDGGAGQRATASCTTPVSRMPGGDAGAGADSGSAGMPEGGADGQVALDAGAMDGGRPLDGGDTGGGWDAGSDAATGTPEGAAGANASDGDGAASSAAGCGCRLVEASADRSSGVTALVLLALGAFGVRRRRRGPSD
jgi:MYXO-CTERM domain-containing protein